MKMRRIVAFLLAVALSASVFSGCSQNSATPSSPATGGGTSAASAAENVTIKVACWDKATMPEFQTAVDAFDAKNPNIKIELVDKPSSEYTNNLSIMLNGGSDLDAFWIKDADTTLAMQKKGSLPI